MSEIDFTIQMIMSSISAGIWSSILLDGHRALRGLIKEGLRADLIDVKPRVQGPLIQ
jgi:hypothetical protein